MKNRKCDSFPIIKTILLFCFFSLITPLIPMGGKVVWEKFDWKVIKGTSFDVHYPQGYESLGKTTLLFAEEANILLSRKMGHKLSQAISIFVYPSHSHFQMTNIIYYNLDEGIGGFTERIKKRVVLPFMGSYDGFRHVLTHELVHAFQYDILLGSGFSGLLASQYVPNPPLWLVEGMAEFFSIGWDETADMTMRDAVTSNTLPTLEQLTNQYVLSGYILYKGGQAVMRYIDEKYGSEKIVELLKDFRDLRNLEEAFKVNFGITMAQFDEQWQLWVKRKYYSNIHRNIDDEEGHLISRHLEDRSFLNMHPAQTQDGKRIAYLTIRNYFPAIVIRDIPKLPSLVNFTLQQNEERDYNETILVQGGTNPDFYQLHLLDNKISFTPDGKAIFFCARSEGRDHLYLIDVKKKKILKKFTPALDMIQYPQLANDGKTAVFTGTILGQPDLYMLDLETSKVRQITYDFFTEKHASFSGDNLRIVYSTNFNEEKNAESTDYNLYEVDIPTNKSSLLLAMAGNQVHPSYFNKDGQEWILFSSNHLGVFNAYLFERNSRSISEITNVSGGIFNPQLNQNGDRLLFTTYRKQGYDISIKKEPLASTNKKNEIQDTSILEISKPEYPILSEGLSKYTVEDYNIRVSPDWLFFGFQYSNFYGLGAFTSFSLSDYLGDHSLSGYFDYLSKRDALNFQASYGFLKNRTKYFLSAFHASNYYSIFSVSTSSVSANDFLYNPNQISEYVRKYGLQAAAQYPVSPFFFLISQLEISRYEEVFRTDIPVNFLRKDIFTNIYAINIGILYNNVLYSIMGPLSGWHLSYNIEQSMNLSGQDYVYHRQFVDLRGYLFFFGRYVLANRLMAGFISGPEADFFPWQIGGYNTLRTFEFLSLKGTKIFTNNLELRFPLIDAVIFGFPVQWMMRGFSAVLFLDIGATTDNLSTLKGTENGRLNDLKGAFGIGARLLIGPGFMLKIDWGTPTDFVSSLPMSKWQGVFSLGYEY